MERLSSSACLELSEQQLTGDAARLAWPMAHLRREFGVQFALDDVGFGRSGLESLILLEPDVLKVDRPWVQGVAADPLRRHNLKRMVQVAKAVNDYAGHFDHPGFKPIPNIH